MQIVATELEPISMDGGKRYRVDVSHNSRTLLFYVKSHFDYSGKFPWYVGSSEGFTYQEAFPSKDTAIRVTIDRLIGACNDVPITYHERQ